jgi:hypothetical protein
VKRSGTNLWYMVNGAVVQNPTAVQLELATHWCREGDKTWTEIVATKPATESTRPATQPKPLFAR